MNKNEELLSLVGEFLKTDGSLRDDFNPIISYYVEVKRPDIHNEVKHLESDFKLTYELADKGIIRLWFSPKNSEGYRYRMSYNEHKDYVKRKLDKLLSTKESLDMIKIGDIYFSGDDLHGSINYKI